MQNNFYFLCQLIPDIKEKIVGLKLMEAFSQDKDELMLCFAAARGDKSHYNEFYIKAAVYPRFSCLYFSDSFHRAKRNTVSLLENAYDGTVVDVIQYENERCFSINFDNGFTLLFKLFGSRSNIILFEKERPIFLFNKKLEADNGLAISNLNRLLPQSYEDFVNAEGNYKKLFPTFGKVVAAYLEKQGLEDSTDLTKNWELITNTLEILRNPVYQIIEFNGELNLSLVPYENPLSTFENPIEASNAFFIKYSQSGYLLEHKTVALRKLLKEKKQTDAYLDSSYKRLEGIEEGLSNEQRGHLIMANMHQIEERLESTEVENFYDENQVVNIRLKSDLSPQKNAEWYYRKAKNEKIEIDKLSENISLREQKLTEINEYVEAINAFENLKELRNYLKVNSLANESSNQDKLLPFNKFTVNGFEIWVGKNAKSNDKLIQQHSYKEDLWMHARDAAGSHVLLKYQSGKPFPKHVIETAAGVAAYNSKRRTEGLVPVIVTPKKFVRKAKGLAPGQVIVDKEEVIIVEPISLKDAAETA
jgi:predicted ribosome quality control (RQC) complex YloA/Tae2 family protein